jgi:hypothetical protein
MRGGARRCGLGGGGWSGGGIVELQRRLFDWHCEQFFDFRAHLSAGEMEYVELCMEGSGDRRNVAELYSFYSYSHKVDGASGVVDSSRLAYGLLHGTEAIREAGLALATAKGMDAAPFEDGNCEFYGLGWDFAAGVDKVYFRYGDFDRLDGRHRALVEGDGRPFARSGILSFSYRGGRLAEEKVYRFTRHRWRRNYAVLFSKKRRVEQRNHRKWRRWGGGLGQFSEAARRLIGKYREEQGIDLDTYAVDPAGGWEMLYFDY